MNQVAIPCVPRAPLHQANGTRIAAASIARAWATRAGETSAKASAATAPLTPHNKAAVSASAIPIFWVWGAFMKRRA